jgi:predicted nuclease of predicted toxin-antitoxin system
MKFLVDAQLPKKLADFLKTKGVDAIHTLDLPGKNHTTDEQVIEISSRENRVVITKDADFFDSHLLRHLPGKVIMVKTGNIHNKELITLFDGHFDFICEELIKYNYVEISIDAIVIL